MADNKFVTLEALKSTAARLQQEWLKSISKAGHATFRKAEAIPTVDEAQDNVMYLVMNDKTQHYDIYAKVEGAVVLLDDTTVDLSGYATKEQLEAVSGGLGGTVYAATKADLSASDDSVISGYFDQNKDAKPKKGDVFVVTTTVDGSTYEQSAYFYDGSAWAAMTGSVDADKVILRDNITLAGGYTQVGNLTDSGKKPADFVAAETGKRLMTDAEGTKLGDIAEGATKVEKSATNGNVKINGVETVVYTEPSDVIHGTVASDEDVTAMLTEVFGA